MGKVIGELVSEHKSMKFVRPYVKFPPLLIADLDAFLITVTWPESATQN